MSTSQLELTDIAFILQLACDDGHVWNISTGLVSSRLGLFPLLPVLRLRLMPIGAYRMCTAVAEAFKVNVGHVVIAGQAHLSLSLSLYTD